jgi:hypothetical protein
MARAKKKRGAKAGKAKKRAKRAPSSPVRKAKKTGKVKKTGKAKKATRARKVTRRVTAKPAPKARKKVVKPAAAPAPRATAAAAPLPRAEPQLGAAPAAAPTLSRLDSLQKKRVALSNMEQALRAKPTNSAEERMVATSTLNSLTAERQQVDAEIAAATTGTLSPPGDAQVSALLGAIAQAENVIQQNAAVNDLVRAATTLIRTMKA